MRFLFNNFILIVFLLLSSLCYIATGTEWGFQHSIEYLSTLSSDKLTIGKVRGKLFSSFELDDIRYHDENQDVRIKSLAVTWNPMDLFRDKLSLEKLELGDTLIKIQHDTGPINIAWLKYINFNELAVEHLVFQNDFAEVELKGKLANQWNLSWQAKFPNLSKIAEDISGDLQTSGHILGPYKKPSLDATFVASGFGYKDFSADNATGKIDLNLNSKSDSQLHLSIKNIKSTQYEFKPINATVAGKFSLDNHELKSKYVITVADLHTVHAEINLPQFITARDLHQPIKGNLALETNHLELLKNIFPEIKDPKGNLTGKFKMTGELIKPEISGEVLLKDGQFNIPQLGARIENVFLHFHKPNDQIVFDGGFQAGSGKAKVTGKLDLTDSDIQVTTHINGENLKLINLSEYKIDLSPDLTIETINQNIKIEGSVFIPFADIKPNNTANAISMPTSEVVFTDKAAPKTSLPINSLIKLNLKLGDKIQIAFKELQTNLKGNLQISQYTKGNLTAVGELYSTKGTYDAYGQVLNIQEGRLIFTGGPIINPGINIRAGKQIKSVALAGKSSFNDKADFDLKPVYSGTELISVGIQLTGTFENPNISLYSNPANLNQGDILSYLIFGYPQSHISDSQTGALLSAASAFSGKSKFSSIATGVQNKLGLSEMNVQPRETFNPTTGGVDSTTSFVVGKQLAPKLYANYSIGLFAPLSILNLRYQLSKRFSLQSETSNLDKGADLMYSIERD